MKKFIYAIASVFMMTAAVCLTACGGDDDNNNTPDPSPAPTKDVAYTFSYDYQLGGEILQDVDGVFCAYLKEKITGVDAQIKSNVSALGGSTVTMTVKSDKVELVDKMLANLSNNDAATLDAKFKDIDIYSLTIKGSKADDKQVYSYSYLPYADIAGTYTSTASEASNYKLVVTNEVGADGNKKATLYVGETAYPGHVVMIGRTFVYTSDATGKWINTMTNEEKDSELYYLLVKFTEFKKTTTATAKLRALGDDKKNHTVFDGVTYTRK